MKNAVISAVFGFLFIVSDRASASMRFTHHSEEEFHSELVKCYLERSLDELVLCWIVEDNSTRRILLIAAIVCTRDLVGADEEMRNLIFLVSRSSESEREQRLQELASFRAKPSVAARRLRDLLEANKNDVPDRLDDWASGGLKPWGQYGGLRTD